MKAKTKPQLDKSNKAQTSVREDYDLLVLGSGEGGKFLAWTLARQGMKVAVVERKYIGGSCPNIACLPSKNVIHSAKVASYFFRGHEFGISKDKCRINMGAVRERKRKMVEGLIQMHLENYKASGAELILGSGRFVAPKSIEATSADGSVRQLRGKNVVINTGTRATIDHTPGLTEAAPLTHVEALELDRIPEHLIVMGGGYVGLEFSQAMRRFGSRVTIIEHNPSLLHREDGEVSQALQELFQNEGIDVLTGTFVTQVQGKSGSSVKLRAVRAGSEITLESTDLLVATGRTPNTEGIGLDLAGVELTDHGYIKVNERLQTTASGVWAVGDCAGSPHFTHISFDDYRVVRDNILGRHRVTTGRQVPFCMFTDPEFARVGLNESEAKQRGIPYRLARIPMIDVLRTRTLSETQGFMKALIDRDNDKILGFSVLGVGAGELIATVQVAIIAGMPFTALRDAIFTHPTIAEGLTPLFSNISPATNTARKS
jgi:pyruvate/2-oxoglutarate dehydrogenase complex dihydrolipoamide dehydrogenase (E3) component